MALTDQISLLAQAIGAKIKALSVVPNGGSINQVLTKTGTSNGQYSWQSLPVNGFANLTNATNGLTFYYSDGVIRKGTSYVSISTSNIALRDNAYNFVEGDQKSGSLYNAVGQFTVGRVPLYVIQTDSGQIIKITDLRTTATLPDTQQAQAGVEDFAPDAANSYSFNFAYKGGVIRSDQTSTSVTAGSLPVAANATNYIEVSGTGSVSANTTGFTSGRYPIATVTTNASAITAIADKRGIATVSPASTGSSSSSVVIGTVSFGPAANFDTTYLLCDGAAYARTSYATLAAKDSTAGSTYVTGKSLNTNWDSQNWAFIRGLYAGNTGFVVYSGSAAQRMNYDAGAWNYNAIGTYVSNITMFEQVGSYWYAMGNGSTSLTRSTNFSTASPTFTSITLTTAINPAGMSCYQSGPTYVLLANNSGTWYTSSDGLTFTANTGLSVQGWLKVICPLNTHVAVGTNGIMYASTTALSWTQATQPLLGTPNYFSVVYTGTKYLAFTNKTWGQSTTTGSNDYVTSTDGITWTAAKLPCFAEWTAAVCNGNYVYLIGRNINYFLMSSDSGATWVQKAIPFGDWKDAACGQNQAGQITIANQVLYVIGYKTGYKITFDSTKFNTPVITALHTPNALPYVKAS